MYLANTSHAIDLAVREDAGVPDVAIFDDLVLPRAASIRQDFLWRPRLAHILLLLSLFLGLGRGLDGVRSCRRQTNLDNHYHIQVNFE